jgi:hypothetical protein
MFLNIKDTGTQINQELKDYITQRFEGIGFNQIYISGTSDENKLKEYNIIYENIDLLQNTIAINIEDLNQNIIDWLNTL